jgi:hypothetical protein
VLDPDAVRIDRYCRRTLHRVGDAFEADPAAAIARQGESQEAEIEIFLDIGGVQNRHAEMHQRMLALMGDGRRSCAVIVAAERQHAAFRRRAGIVPMFQRVSGPVDAGSLAVPHGENAIIDRVSN